MRWEGKRTKIHKKTFTTKIHSEKKLKVISWKKPQIFPPRGDIKTGNKNKNEIRKSNFSHQLGF